jgi:hypothetical protein
VPQTLIAYSGEIGRKQCLQNHHAKCFKAASQGSSLDGETRPDADMGFVANPTLLTLPEARPCTLAALNSWHQRQWEKGSSLAPLHFNAAVEELGWAPVPEWRTKEPNRLLHRSCPLRLSCAAET